MSFATKMKSRAKQFNTELEATQHLKKEELRPVILGNGRIKITKRGVRFIMWNVNGIRSVLSKNVMNNMLEKYTPDFICINETKIADKQYKQLKGKLKLSGYHDYWNFCKVSSGYSGVAIYAKYAPISVFEDLEEVAYSQEGRVLTLQYELFYLIVVYMPSAGDRQLKRLSYKVNKYEVAFQKYILQVKEKALKQGRNVIVCGDFNSVNEQIDFQKMANIDRQPSCTSEERRSFKKMLSQGWIDTYRHFNPKKQAYTWWLAKYNFRQKQIGGRRLDYFLVNKEFISAVKQAKICDQVMGSDHCPIFLRIQLKEKNEENHQSSKEKERQSLQQIPKEEKKVQEQPKQTPLNGSKNKGQVLLQEMKNEEQPEQLPFKEKKQSKQLTSEQQHENNEETIQKQVVLQTKQPESPLKAQNQNKK